MCSEAVSSCPAPAGAADQKVMVGRPVSPAGPSTPEKATDFGQVETLFLCVVSSENLQLFHRVLWVF